jgi:hypothetical protein
MNKPYHIVFTTIYQPEILRDLLQNLKQFGHLDKVKVWVVGDYKTPAGATELSKEVSLQGLETVYLDVPTQDEWGKKFEFYSQIPYNNDGRRLVGFMKAMEEKCEMLISIDDDNFPTDDDFIGNHSLTGKVWDGELVSEPSGYHNICEYLKFEPSRSIFPRGFPFKLRGQQNKPHLVKPLKPAIIGLTEGLWLKEPDIDATTWLNGKVHAIAYEGPKAFVLDQETWSPVNTQNTSVVRELIPAYFFVLMGWPVPGGKIDRYGDIWGGYFFQSIVRGTKYYTAFGRPLVEHRRNPHVYVDDLRYEFWGMILTDWLVNLLKDQFKPSKESIVERVVELGEFLENQALEQMPTWSPVEMKNFLTYTAKNLKLWAKACKELLA